MKTAGKLLNWTLALSCLGAWATEPPPDGAKAAHTPQGQASPRVDNTQINARDQDGATKTPQDQTNRAPDRELLAAVRRAIVGDKSLSTMAHNVKVMVEGGSVTLRGPVQSVQEKAQVETLAKRVTGVTKTNNQLDVKTTASTQ